MKVSNHNPFFLFTFLIFTLASITHFTCLQAQNLVPNPGFEEHHFDSVMYWKQPIGQYYHFEINQYSAHSGECMDGICLWRNDVSEYLEVQLISPLIKNKRYEVTAYTKKDMWDPKMYLLDSIQNIGIYFSKDKFEVSHKKYLFFKPQIGLKVYVDSLWCKTHDYFIASGEEKYMILGRFFELTDVPTTETDTAVQRILKEIEDLYVQKSDAIRSAIEVIDEKYKKIQADSWNIDKEKSIRKQEKLIKKFKITMQGRKAEVTKTTNEIGEDYDARIAELQGQHEMSLKVGSGYERFRVYFDDISVIPAPDIVPVKEKIIPLNNVFFNTAEWILLPASFSELNKQVTYLKEKSNLKIEISGHTDNIGNDAANKLLSENRAKAVVEYFIQNGISSDRLTYKGYGSTKPIANNQTEEGRAKNRRVEMKIISE